MSETPRTDAQYKEYVRRDDNVKCIDIDFARTLKRELFSARQAILTEGLRANKFESELSAANARIAELEKDKARLDWLSKQNTLAIWHGSFSNSEYNISLGRAGAPICTLSTLDNDGIEVDKEIAGADSLRTAIDIAMKANS